MSRKLIPLVLMLLLSGCGSYYSLNGVPLQGQEEQQTGLSAGNPPNLSNMTLKNLQRYCNRNPAICVTAGVGVIGLTGFIISQTKEEDKTGCPPNC